MIAGTIAIMVISVAIFRNLDMIAAASASNASIIMIIFGSFSGIAALIVAINTVQLRRENRRKDALQLYSTNRMDTFETSQASLQAALVRADMENERLRTEVAACDTEIEHLKQQVVEIPRLRLRITELETEVEELKNGK